MRSATAMGIIMVLALMPADLAVVITGVMIRATTAGRMPLKILLNTSLFLMASGVRNMAIARIITNDGKIVPKAAHKLPLKPRNLSPMTVDILTAKMPGIDWAMASRSRNSVCSIQWCLSTISR